MIDDPRTETLLRQRTRFRTLVHVLSCTSTQDLAAARSEHGGGPADDAVFWADHQTKGRGRQQREWHDEPGADLAVTFRTTVVLPAPTALPPALPVAVLQAIEAATGATLRIKWPNDLFVSGRKVCGVLVDRGVGGADTYLVGIGVNVNRTRLPPDLEPTATSLALATGREFDRGELLVAIGEHLEAMLQALVAQRHEPLVDLFAERLGLLGRRVEVEAATTMHGELTAVDFAQLVLDGTRRVPLASVRALRADRG